MPIGLYKTSKSTTSNLLAQGKVVNGAGFTEVIDDGTTRRQQLLLPFTMLNPGMVFNINVLNFDVALITSFDINVNILGLTGDGLINVAQNALVIPAGTPSFLQYSGVYHPNANFQQSVVTTGAGIKNFAAVSGGNYDLRYFDFANTVESKNLIDSPVSLPMGVPLFFSLLISVSNNNDWLFDTEVSLYGIT